MIRGSGFLFIGRPRGVLERAGSREPADGRRADIEQPGDIRLRLALQAMRCNASWRWCAVSLRGRPNRTPRSRARLRPSPVRAAISERSNSARPPSTVSMSLPWGVVVSAQVSLSERKRKCSEGSNDFRSATPSGHDRARLAGPLSAMCGRLRVGKSFLHVSSIGRCSHVFGL